MTAETEPHPPVVDSATDLDLVVQRVRLRMTLRLAWLAHLAALGHTDTQIATADLDRLSDEATWRAANAPGELLGALDAAELLLRQGTDGRVGHLVELFGLSAPEVDLLHVCLAVDLDPRLGEVFATLHRHPDRRHPTEAAAARLCDRDGPILATSESPLRMWELVVEEPVGPGEAPALRIDRTVAAWVQGVAELDHRLAGVARAGAAHEPLSSWPVAEIAERCRPRGGATQPDPVRVVVRGEHGSGRRSFAIAVSRHLGLGSYEVESDRVEPAWWRACFTAAQRQAFLDGWTLVWSGQRASEEMWPAATPLFPIQFVVVGPDTQIAAAPELTDIVVDLAPPSLTDRWALWRHYVPASDAWPEPDRSDLVERAHTVVADIEHVGRHHPTSPAVARELLRRRNRDRLGPLVTPMPLPYGIDDLVLPDRVLEQLDFLLFECRQRRTFWSDGQARLFPQSGLVALLAGPSGVGKTMAAQVLAAELGVDLLRVNLAETISKYVGETAKNLDRVLSDARDLDAVLLCDEADTLFGRRTEIRDAHDRYANADTNFLLQAIESYPGVALLATNRKDQLDQAFLRRLRHVVEVPRPDRDARAELWRRLLTDVGADVPDQASDGPVARLIDQLAQHIDLTGAEIKHSVLNAAFVARRRGRGLTADDLLDGLDRELAKQGRSLSDIERRKVLGG